MLNLAHAIEENFITHHPEVQSSFEKTRLRLQETDTSLLALPLEEELKILEDLSQTKLGQFLLKNRGLNGEWTAYIIRKTPQSNFENDLEEWIINNAPVVQATRERSQIFQQKIQKQVPKGGTFASIPCGLMDDLLTLNAPHLQLVGIDIDEQSLSLAKKNALHHQKDQVSSFIKKDAWHLNTQNQYSLIASNGLNIYERNDNKVIDLYKEFYDSLVPGGILVTSFLTPPPWDKANVDDLKKQKAIFGDILQASWQHFRSESQTRQQLEAAGFTILEIIYDTQRLFPTVVAQKE